jgi:tetratricopeptide (TPR) repeat protein
MTTLPSLVNELWTGRGSPQIMIVEAAPGVARRRWLEDRLQDMAECGARTFSVCCDFDSGGPWAGVSGLFSALLTEMQEQRPELVERHALELVYVFPQLRRSLAVRNPSLTDLAPPNERTRNYAADRAFRIVHGLIDLLDSWKIATDAESPWVIACDGYDLAGAISSRFFRELMRRRGESLHLRLLVCVEDGHGEEARASLGAGPPTEVIRLSLAAGPLTATDRGAAAQMARELEERVGDDPLEVQLHLAELIRLWQLADRPDKLLYLRYLGLETYNTLGLYDDALRYGNGLLTLAVEHAPRDESLQWSILIKLLMSHISLGDVQTSLKLAQEQGLKLVEHEALRRVQLFYLMAMFYARFLEPRDLTKGEEYLERGLAAIEEIDPPESERHFYFVFNRNGLAMIRNFQGRHQEAIELCRSGIERLNAHLSAEQHRLHRSILLYNIAQVYAATRSYTEAIEHYSAAMAMDPNYSEYYNERGNVFLHLGRLKEARTDYLRAIELSPPYFEVLTNLGQCYRRMGAMADAIESYSKALDLEPDHLLALMGRAKAHEELAHVEAAIADYSAALAQDSEQWQVVASRGVMYYEAGEIQASLADFDRSIQLKADEADLYQNRATVLADLGQYQEAARDLQTALELNPPEEDKPALLAKLETALLAASPATKTWTRPPTQNPHSSGGLV